MDAYRVTHQGRATMLLSNARRRAKAAKLPLTVDQEWVAQRIACGYCALTGLPFVLTANKGRHPCAPSIDRIRQAEGYTPENSQIIITAANLGRAEWDDSVLLTWATALVKLHESKH